MTRIAPVDEIALRWGSAPESAIDGDRGGCSAALWRFRADAPHEMIEHTAEANSAMHIVTAFTSGSVDHELFCDARSRYSAHCQIGVFNLVRAGEKPRSLMRPADFSALLIFLPDALLRACADDTAVELVAVGAEFDPQIQRIAREILLEME